MRWIYCLFDMGRSEFESEFSGLAGSQADLSFESKRDDKLKSFATSAGGEIGNQPISAQTGVATA